MPKSAKSEKLIVANNLRKEYGEFVAVNGINFVVHKGESFGLLGPNGAGKSSLFAMLRGELHPEHGDLEMPPNWVIAHVAQETPALSQAAIEFTLDGDVEFRGPGQHRRRCGHHFGVSRHRRRQRFPGSTGYGLPARHQRYRGHTDESHVTSHRYLE